MSGRLGQLDVSDDRRFAHFGTRLGHEQTQPDPVSIEFQLLVTVFVDRRFQRQSENRLGRRCGASVAAFGVAATDFVRSLWLVEPDLQPRGISANCLESACTFPWASILTGRTSHLHTRRG